MTIALERVYDEPSTGGGCRILVDRLWPRGLSKQQACVDLWAREVAPSDGLRRWYHAHPEAWAEFKRRYFAELREQPEAVEAVLERARAGPVTLLFASREPRHNNAAALREHLRRKLAPRRRK